MLPFSHSIYWKDFKLLWTQWTETATAKYFQIVCCSPWWRILLSCGWWWNIWWNIWSDYMLNNMLCFSSGLCALSGDPALCLLKLAWPLNIINVNLGLCCTCICNEELCAQTHLNALQKTREMGMQLINKHTHTDTQIFFSVRSQIDSKHTTLILFAWLWCQTEGLRRASFPSVMLEPAHKHTFANYGISQNAARTSTHTHETWDGELIGLHLFPTVNTKQIVLK